MAYQRQATPRIIKRIPNRKKVVRCQAIAPIVKDHPSQKLKARPIHCSVIKMTNELRSWIEADFREAFAICGLIPSASGTNQIKQATTNTPAELVFV